jgi:hypothetical protein
MDLFGHSNEMGIEEERNKQKSFVKTERRSSNWLSARLHQLTILTLYYFWSFLFRKANVETSWFITAWFVKSLFSKAH